MKTNVISRMSDHDYNELLDLLDECMTEDLRITISVLRFNKN